MSAYVRSHTDTTTRNPQHRHTDGGIRPNLVPAGSAGAREENDRRARFTDESTAHAKLGTDTLIEEMQRSPEEPQ